MYVYGAEGGEKTSTANIKFLLYWYIKTKMIQKIRFSSL